ncbi:hypothetical protein CupriaWKF_17660 [Cupriavidus sp. WKF15]|uniref:helix-turn-helix transcriptional regulator n=1 Tax=Cupriavidus sp. WKF15 TaxID=3032282 RepID=UPI0023E1DD59|nr:hypothetical protein [Cupriavidus sp. WKF15]WER49007.1 hypothetical protein CupriaWKF_17660 [Cupriavidus sp. WKF15]
MAAECGLSRGYFASAFRRSTGISAHRWPLQQRVELALSAPGPTQIGRDRRLCFSHPNCHALMLWTPCAVRS